MNKFLSIQKTALYLGVSTQTLRRWENKKKISPSHRTKGGQRRYDVTQLLPIGSVNRTQQLPTIAYARVSSHDQKEDLQRQIQMLEMYCAARGWIYSIIKDHGARSHKNKQLIANLQAAVTNV
jgi:putative resolvase